MASAKVLVIGSTGNVGLEVARSLQALQVPFRAGDIDTERVRQRLGEGTEAVRFSFGDESTYIDAFRGTERVFLMRPPRISNVQKYMFPAIDAAVTAGVKHFVFLSLIGIESNRIVPHYKVEQYLKQSGVDYTFLRSSFFMQNLNTTHCNEIRDRDELYIPAGRSRTSFVDTRDIGAAAAAVLTQPGHAKQAYEITGPESLTYYEVSRQMSEVLGRSITYRSPALLAFVLRKVREGTPLTYALVMAFLYNSTKNGMANVVTDEVERLIGRKPFTLRQYLHDYRASWAKPAQVQSANAV